MGDSWSRGGIGGSSAVGASGCRLLARHPCQRTVYGVTEHEQTSGGLAQPWEHLRHTFGEVIFLAALVLEPRVMLDCFGVVSLPLETCAFFGTGLMHVLLHPQGIQLLAMVVRYRFEVA